MPSSRPYLSRVIRSIGGTCVLLTLGFLGGCSDDDAVTSFAPACPAFDVPGSVADRFVYNGKGIDVSHLVSHAQITDVNGDCRDGPQDSHHRPLTRVRLSLALRMEHGPAATEKTDDITYFVAITHDGAIVDKKIFHETIRIAANNGAQQLNTPLRFIDLPTGDNPQVSPYTLEIGFQLTRNELDYNRQHLTYPAHFIQHTQ
ncbi:hypothetical protein [Saccharibacter sp. 17.LH.SD]|uniref:hypothetical protein n=1 Tax=Saccharibacter sp. 17.LH.SD TaxID=2689393 RepID=UPI001F222EAD|nr:hypothetical protein [Saccharibacter sp. 17.LH.SD]